MGTGDIADSKQVAYAWHIERGCDLRIIGLDGSEPPVIYRNEEIGCIAVQDWSPTVSTFWRLS